MSACPLYYKNKLSHLELDLMKAVSKDEFIELLKINFPSICENEIQSTLRMSEKFFITLGAEIYQVNGC